MSVRARCEEETRRILNHCRVDLPPLSVKESTAAAQLSLDDFVQVARSEIRNVVSDSLRTPLANGAHCDLEMVFRGGETVMVHKFIVAANSADLAALIAEPSVTSLVWPEVGYQEGKLLTEALYTGRVSFDRRHAVSLASVEAALSCYRQVIL